MTGSTQPLRLRKIRLACCRKHGSLISVSKCNVSVVCCCLILAGGPALTGATEPAEETPGDVTYSTSPAAGGWNAGTRAQPSRQSQSPVEPGPAEMTLRLYDGARDFGPVYGNKGEVMAILDVTSELETCADGNTIGAVRCTSAAGAINSMQPATIFPVARASP